MKTRMEFTPVEQFQGFLATPQIFTENAIFDYPLYQTVYPTLREKPAEISAPTESILGKRMEHYFACYITHISPEEILLQNHQVIQNKETLGEIDFLLKNTASKEISHIELIYKFYLFDPNTGTSELDHLIGPNKRDSLNRKLERLQKRQFPLLFHDATKDLLSSYGINPQDVVQKMCFKASVFLPKQMKSNSFKKINPETVSGFWIKASEFIFKNYGENLFFSPKKKFWPVLPELNKTWYSFEDIKNQIDLLLSKNFAPLIWMKTPKGRYERLFIVWW